MSGYIHQKDPEKLKYVDEDLLRDKTGRRAFKSAAYSVGIAVGFLALSPLMPQIGPEARSDAIMSEFRGVALWMIGYAIVVTAAFFLARKHVKIVLFMLNWFVMPVILVSAFMEISKLMSGGA